MTDHVAQLRAAPLPAVVIERCVGITGWPAYRVFYLGAHFGEDGERYIECPDHAGAIETARIMAACSGWPVNDRSIYER